MRVKPIYCRIFARTGLRTSSSMKVVHMTIGARIERLRGKESRRSFAKRIGVAENTLRNYEDGLSLPNSDKVAEICSTLNVAADWLLFGRGLMHPGETAPAFDLTHLTSAISAVERGLEETDRQMEPEKKAELIAAVYELFAENTAVEPARIIRLIRAAA